MKESIKYMTVIGDSDSEQSTSKSNETSSIEIKIEKCLSKIESDTSSDTGDEFKEPFKIPEKKIEYWSLKETTYLLAGIILFGRSWTKILKLFKSKFHPKRNRMSLFDRFKIITLPRNQDLLTELNRKAQKLVIKIKKSY